MQLNYSNKMLNTNGKYKFMVIMSLSVTLNNTWLLKSARHTVSTLDRVSVALGVQEKVHAVVIDAGSTGSRVLAFTFFKSLSGQLCLVRMSAKLMIFFFLFASGMSS